MLCVADFVSDNQSSRNLVILLAIRDYQQLQCKNPLCYDLHRNSPRGLLRHGDHYLNG